MCTKSGVSEGRAYLCRLYAGVNEVTSEKSMREEGNLSREEFNQHVEDFVQIAEKIGDAWKVETVQQVRIYCTHRNSRFYEKCS